MSEEKKVSLLRRFGRRVKNAIFRGSAPVPLISTILTQYPVLMPLEEIYKQLTELGNKYDVYRTLTKIDPELYGAINRLALLTKSSYKGIGVAFGEELDDHEKELLRAVIKIDQKWDFASIFYSVAFHLLRDGDDIYAIKLEDNVGLTGFRPLPIPYVTLIETNNQMGQIDAQIFEPNICVFNELDEPVGTASDAKRQQWNSDEFIQFSLSNRAEIVNDILGRFTFGVWSVSPIEPLKARLLWKLAILINDIVLRQKLVPREHHKLDLSAFDPALFAGETLDDRIRAAKTAATTHINQYKTDVTDPLREVDKSYITDKQIEIGFVEPKNVTYIDPNPLMDQISRSIAVATGSPESIATGRGRGTYASELVVASYVSACVEALADIIKTQLVKLVRRSIRIQYKEKYTDEDLDKIDIRIRSMLGLEKGEATRRAAIMEATGIATLDELRNEVGLDRTLTLEEKEELRMQKVNTQGRPIAERTISDIISDYMRRKDEPTQDTPESDRQRKQT